MSLTLCVLKNKSRFTEYIQTEEKEGQVCQGKDI
jgi:hypothetical protein